MLEKGCHGLSLRAGNLMLTPDFTDMLPRLRPAALNRELLVRACRIKGLVDGLGRPRRTRIIDATAGLGEDSLLLAASGAEVLLCESDSVICALLRDALQRAIHDERLAGVAAHMTVHEGDSVQLLHSIARPGGESSGSVFSMDSVVLAGSSISAGSVISDGSVASAASAAVPAPTVAPPASFVAPDVVYLDPMFPERRKSAAVKKKFQLLHRLESPCENDEELLQAALSAHPKRVVVKRPVKGPFLAGVKPSYSLSGKAVRFDVIVR